MRQGGDRQQRARGDSDGPAEPRWRPGSAKPGLASRGAKTDVVVEDV